MPRLNKRQQRELEEIQVLAGDKTLAEDVPKSDDSDSPSTSFKPAIGAFSSFLVEEEHDSDGGDEEVQKSNSKPRKKKKKKATTTTAPIAAVDVAVKSGDAKEHSQASGPLRNEKKALKKARAKEKKAANDELDKVLAELSVQYPASQKLNQSTANGESLADLLSVSLQHLDSEAEMRKFFGSRVVQANKITSGSQSGPAARRQMASMRSNLTRPQPTWWAAKQREGLSIRQLTEEEVLTKLERLGWSQLEEKWWTVEYSKKYKSMTKAFMKTVLSGDPQGFWDLLGKLPWHADTLLQMSEVYRHREEYAQAVDFVDRALFTYERAFIGAFNFTSGLNRLDFDYVENRPFFLAIHRQITDLQRRGCLRTAFEFARLLYSLDPWTDPHGALLHLDVLATRSGMSQWLLDVFELFSSRREQHGSRKGDSRSDPSILPGWAYSRALALWMVEDTKKDKDHVESTTALKEAIFDFPSVVPLLADKIDVSLPASIRGHKDFKIETDAGSLQPAFAVLHLLSHIYVLHSFALWKERSAWFTAIVTDAFSTLPSSLPITERRKQFLSQYQDSNLCFSAYRHVMVLDTSYRRYLSFIPRHVLDAKSLACDPLPPPTAVTLYDEDFFYGIDDLVSLRTRTRRERAVDERRLAQILPDVAFRQQLQAFFDAQPNLVNRFPGGIVQFAQVVAQLPADVLEDMMMAEAMGAEAPGGGGMPGEMPGLEDMLLEIGPGPAGMQHPQDVIGPQQVPPDAEEGDEVSEEDEDEDEDELSPMPRMIRNILGRFWGRTTAPNDASSDEEPLDDIGID